MIQIDIAIIGGGISGLWLLNSFKSRGFRTLLFEKRSLGSGQTLASQGMIHGGVKYNLEGRVTNASESIKAMPALWQQCLSGEIQPDLRNVKRLADRYYLFSDGNPGNRLMAFLGSKVLQGNLRRLETSEYPEPLNHQAFKGVVYELPDAILDTADLITELARPHGSDLILGGPQPVPDEDKGISALMLADGASVQAACYVFCAGSGNAALLTCSHLDVPMQIRPLHQVMVKGHDLPEFHAHAVGLRSGNKPRITITSHRTADNGIVWYLGGGLAETGVSRSASEQVGFARQELKHIFPFVNFKSCQWGTLRVDRAEPMQHKQARPDQPFCKRLGNVIVCWPTKLTLVPLLSSRVLSLVTETPSANLNADTTTDLQSPDIALPPWETEF